MLRPSTPQVQGQINVYPDPYAHSAMATRTLLAMDNAGDPWNAAANPAVVDEEATKMKACQRGQRVLSGTARGQSDRVPRGARFGTARARLLRLLAARLAALAG